jgi:hypothetical protein
LSITCNNATNNDKMIDDLAGRLIDFPGAPNRMHCFTHILNLMIKSIMNQFDAFMKRLDTTDERSDDKLFKLAGNIEAEELEAQIEDGNT